jgi:hypothetical protein
MGISVTAYQPRYYPRLHYLARAQQADVFIIYDDVEFSRQSRQHRTRFGGNSDWLTIPIRRDADHASIADVRVDQNHPWERTHLNTLRAAYGGNAVDATLAEFYDFPDDPRLVDVTVPILRELLDRFGIDSTVYLSSDMDASHPGDPSEYLARLTEEVDGDQYISGARGYENYLDETPFDRRGQSVTVQNWEPTWPDGNACCLDVLFDTDDPGTYVR